MDKNKKWFNIYLLLFLAGVLEMGTTGKFVDDLDMGIISIGIAYVFGAAISVLVQTILGLGVIVGLINSIVYYRKWKKAERVALENVKTSETKRI